MVQKSQAEQITSKDSRKKEFIDSTVKKFGYKLFYFFYEQGNLESGGKPNFTNVRELIHSVMFPSSLDKNQKKAYQEFCAAQNNTSPEKKELNDQTKNPIESNYKIKWAIENPITPIEELVNAYFEGWVEYIRTALNGYLNIHSYIDMEFYDDEDSGIKVLINQLLEKKDGISAQYLKKLIYKDAVTYLVDEKENSPNLLKNYLGTIEVDSNDVSEQIDKLFIEIYTMLEPLAGKLKVLKALLNLSNNQNQIDSVEDLKRIIVDFILEFTKITLEIKQPNVKSENPEGKQEEKQSNLKLEILENLLRTKLNSEV